MDKNIKSIPPVTVFMAAYNAAAFIKESVESVLSQTFTDFELLIIDDGSIDETQNILNEIKDSRIRLLSNKENKGITFTRNRGLEEAHGKYIIILDSDDICLPNRILLQYNFMEKHPEVAVCGGQAYLIDEKGQDIGHYPHIPHGIDLGMHLLFRNIFINPSCIIRKSAAKNIGGYRDYSPAEDFDLLVRIARIHKVANLENYLIKYRFHSKNISETNYDVVRNQEKHIIKQMQEYLKINAPELLDTHHRIYLKKYDSLNLEKSYTLLSSYITANNKSKVYPKDLFKEFISGIWKEIVFSVTSKNQPPFWYLKKDLFSWKVFTIKDLLRILKKSFK